MSTRANKRHRDGDTSQASTLLDKRQGTYDQVANQTKPDDSEPTEHERAQGGGGMQGEPIPTNDFALPEGIRRQPTGPYSRDKGRSRDVPEHVPKHAPKTGKSTP